MPTRLEKISLIVLLYSLVINFKDTLRLRKIYFNYLKSYIKLSNPEYLITFIDNDKRFYELKKYFNNIKFIAIQNGYRFFKNDLFELIENSQFILNCDEYYCFGDQVKHYLKNKINAKCYAIGSLKNNFCKISEETKKKNICYISSYGISTNTFEKQILENLMKYCDKKNIKLEILPRTNLPDEENFYKKILKNNNFILHKKSDDFCNSYKVVDSAMISITLNNTLGYENLGRENKTYFINVNDRNLDCNSFLKFGYPEKFEEKGFFWTNKFDPKKTIEEIDYIYDLSSAEWKNQTNEIIKKVIIYDPGNIFLKKRLNQL